MTSSSKENCFDERLLTVKEFAEITRIRPSTLYELARTGRIPHYHIYGSLRLKLADFKEGGEVPPGVTIDESCTD